MKSNLTAGCALSLLLLCANAAHTAHAEDNFVYGSVGTGAELGFGRVLNDSFSVRADIGRDGYGVYQHRLGGNDYDIKPQHSTRADVLLDWFPITGNGFHVSGGLAYFNNPTTESTATPDSGGNYHINGNSYSATTVGQLRATSSYDKFRPEIGIGWDSAPANKPGWRLMSGLNLTVATGGHTKLAASNSGQNNALLQDINTEQSRVSSDFGNKRADLNFSLGVGYTF
ncbi:hypothetical protein AAKU67_000690 [Oxalobacteraceae bacterium GrIS 2.11]